MKQKIEAVATRIAELIILAPCLAIFNEGEDFCVNLIGCLYALILFSVIKSIPAIKQAKRNARKGQICSI